MTEQSTQPENGSDEYNQQKAAEFKAGHGTPSSENIDSAPIPLKPENGQDKFYNAETGEYNWQAHAAELEYRMKGGSPDTETEGEKSTEAAPEADTDNAALNIVSNAGLDVDSLIQQIQQEGNLSDEAKNALIATGVDASLIDSYVDNLKFRMDAESKSALEYVGGEEEWGKINAWAENNLSAEDKEAYNDTLNGENWKMAADAIKSRMGQNAEPNLMLGNELGNTASGYRSRAEMKIDMSNPEYKSNPTFRQSVIDKMSVSTYDLDQYQFHTASFGRQPFLG